MGKRRFSKGMALDMLIKKADDIAKEQRFDRNNGTAQLGGKTEPECSKLNRAVEYGRMRAFEEMAQAIDGGYSL